MGRSVSMLRLQGERLSRRRLLVGSVAALGMATLGLAGCSDRPNTEPASTPPPWAGKSTPWSAKVAASPAAAEATVGPAAAPSPAPAKFSQWSRHARVANASFGGKPEELELQRIVLGLKAQNVSVVETDTRLSDWLNDDEFKEVVEEARIFNRLVHLAGLKVVWYYPALEIISKGGQHGPSFAKTHPDWLQLDLEGRPNKFYGGVVFWVEAGDESAWLSPNGPYRQYYLNRVKLLAQTGADGIWPDVPLYFLFADWCDASPWGRSAFKTDTGLDLPKAANWADPVFRRWVEWRHRNLNQYLIDIGAAGRSVNPDFGTVVETVTCDYYDATKTGLDGAYLRLAEGVTHVWEVDAISNADAMRSAREDDWICLISMYKYCRAASGTKPAWAFSYGLKEDDAVQVMAECLAAGCNPYEVKIPEKTVGVSAAMRTRMYGFVKAHSERLFEANSLANVALYHSSASRDYVQPGEGSGLFATTLNRGEAGSDKWWSVNRKESCYEQQWLGEYRGTVKALVHAHIPFNVLTSPTLRPEDFKNHRVLLLPDLEAASDGEAAIIRQFVAAGGMVVITGPNPTGLNEFGDVRAEYALADVLGFSKRTPPPATKEANFGAGKVFYFLELPGWQYLRGTTQADYDKLIGSILSAVTPLVTTSADRRVHLEASSWGEETVLQFTNFIGVTGNFKVVPTSFTVSVAVPEGRQVKEMAVSSPDNPTADLQPLSFAVDRGKVTFSLNLKQYSLVVMS